MFKKLFVLFLVVFALFSCWENNLSIKKEAQFADTKWNMVYIYSYSWSSIDEIKNIADKSTNIEWQTTWTYFYNNITTKEAKEIEIKDTFAEVQDYLSKLSKKEDYLQTISYSWEKNFTNNLKK